ncbi:histidine kinase [Clostridium paraputrificum]|uniref:histidine kinase n=1 Tax=Clostridium paraputrificum TaxID=29363 RepID=UPI003D32D4D0
MEELLTIKDLAKRWKCHEETIRENIRQGIISPCKNVPIKNRFSPSYILEIEGVELERFSPILKKRMEKEIDKLKKENKELKQILVEQASLGTRCMQFLNFKELFNG